MAGTAPGKSDATDKAASFRTDHVCLYSWSFNARASHGR